MCLRAHNSSINAVFFLLGGVIHSPVHHRHRRVCSGQIGAQVAMIKHFVMWRLKPAAEGASRESQARELQARLEALPAAIPDIQRLEVGINVSASARAADVVLVAKFGSAEELAAYSAHPAHREEVVFIREIAAETRVVDYEV